MIRALLLVVCGVAASVAAYGLLIVRENAPEASPTGDIAALAADAETIPPQPAFEPASDPQLRRGIDAVKFETPAPRLVRDVTPATITAAPQRVAAAPPPPAEAAPPAAAAAPAAHLERLFNPIVVTAGTIKLRDREIHLAGVSTPAFDKHCGTGATTWPCGRLARAELRAFIHGRAIECEIPAGADKVPDTAKCQVAGDDLSQWLVAQGWAASDGSQFAADEKKARDAKLGLWGDRRPDVQAAGAAGD